MSFQDTMEQFIPGPETGKALRGALSRFGTGVTIVTTMTEDGPVGIAANSFSSVSLDPALVLWSVGRASRRYPYFSKAKHMAIHVLGADQLDLCNAFAASPHAFEGAVLARAGANPEDRVSAIATIPNFAHQGVLEDQRFSQRTAELLNILEQHGVHAAVQAALKN